MVMTPKEQFNCFQLIFDIKCLDCCNQDTIKLVLGDLFNLEGDNEKNIDCNCACSVCKLNIFLDFAKIFKPNKIREIYNGIVLLQENCD